MKETDDVIGRLNVLIALELRKTKKERTKKATRELVKLLSDNGLEYKEIANIMGMSPGTIANELTYLKGKRK